MPSILQIVSKIGRGGCRRFLPFLMWLTFAPVMAAVGDGKFDLDIPAADADIALKHLSCQTGHSVIFQSVEVEDIQTNSLAGRYTIHVAR